MAYGSAKHEIFSERMKNWAQQAQTLRDELERLDDIYIEETVSGTHAAFVSNSIATKQEHIDMIVYMRAFRDFNENAAVTTLNRVGNLTAFTSNP